MTGKAHTDTAPFLQRTLAALRASLSLPLIKASVALALGAAGSAMAIVLNAPHPPIASVFLAFGLAWASLIDIDRFKLPNVITVGLIIGGLAQAATLGWDEFTDRSIGAVAGYLCLLAIAEVYRHVRNRSGLGYGDAKLLAVGGAWLGWSAIPFVVLIASGVGLAVLILAGARRKIQSDKPIAFGPFLATAIFFLWILAS